ncbi:unnamed protein product [Lymnaea stagnalis]|uniref:Prokineticin domain-containing protein n=1 Tax=Lymnaea stagnalis TaxID=6523 RepID=A0AAV2HTE0_LYMST
MTDLRLGFLIVVSLICLSEAGRRDSGHLRETKSCATSADCECGQCCLSPAVFRGKREAEGSCQPRLSAGDRCYVNNDQFLPSHSSHLYYNGCPCESGQTCFGSGQFEVPQGEIGFCTLIAPSKKAIGDSCSSGKDCAADECCVSTMRPLGRKKRLAVGGGRGACQKLGKAGDSCLVSVTTAEDTNWDCPCVSGLTCKGQGMFEIPLGERGQCG